MADIDSEVGPADRRHAHKLVERAEGIECCADVPPDLDLEAIAGLLDPRALGIRELNRLAHRLEKLAREEAFLDLGAISSATVARLIGDASADQLAGVMTLPTLRCWVLDEMFRRMGRYFGVIVVAGSTRSCTGGSPAAPALMATTGTRRSSRTGHAW